jgi:hypothetical protein
VRDNLKSDKPECATGDTASTTVALVDDSNVGDVDPGVPAGRRAAALAAAEH